MSGRFIVLEGPDGSGTTSHSKRLAERLRPSGEVLLTAEPTAGPVGTRIREVLAGGVKLPPDAVQLLFCADRAAHVESEVRSALARGATVISDRYDLSTLAYGAAFGLDVAWLRHVNAPFPRPDRTLLLLAPVDVCLERVAKRGAGDVFEKRELQERVHAAYRELAAADPSIVVIDSSGTVEETLTAILASLA